MPLTYTRTFRIRFHECDAHGHLNNANYLRYMQETAFDASAASGYDLERYTALERFWLIRESGVEFLHPLHYNESVAVKTWVADFRRATSRRMYEFRRVGTENDAAPEQLVAHAYTDWVYLDTRTNQPAAIPQAVIDDFFPKGVPMTGVRRPFPKSPPRPAGAFQMLRRVAWSDLDTLQHVNNAIYLNYLTECGSQALAAFGWPFQRLQETGLGVFLRRLQIQYLQPALPDDNLELTTWISDVRRAAALRHYTILRAGDAVPVMRAQTYSVWVDVRSGQPARIPAAMLADLAPMIAEQKSPDRFSKCPF